METLMLPFSPRFIVLTICAVVTALLLGIGIFDRKVLDLVLIPIVIFGGLTILGIRDLLQQNHAVLRNYLLLTVIPYRQLPLHIEVPLHDVAAMGVLIDERPAVGGRTE